MNPQPILYPLFAQVGLTFLVWLWMYATRIYTLQKNDIDPNELRSVEDEHRLLKPVLGPSENLVNLSEMPVLFYVACLLAYLSHTLTDTLLTLAWLFVAFRALHSLIHCSYNRVMHRFTAYFISSLCLWGIWFELVRVLAWPAGA
jgi:hypothetical protein